MTTEPLKDKIEKLLQENGVEEIVPAEYDNLILDDTDIVKLTAEDKQYLEQYTTLEALHMNSTKLESLENMPDNEELLRLELSENALDAAQLAHLKKYTNLTTLKLANNKLNTYEDLASLQELKSLKNLNLEKNPVTKLSDYKTRMFTLMPALQVLDNHNRRGEVVFSDDEDSFEEGGEDEIEENFNAQQLNEDLMEELRMRGMSVKDYLAQMQDAGEMGEDDLDDQFSKEPAEGKDEPNLETPSKRQKQ